MECLLWHNVRDLWGDFYMFLKGVNLPNHRAEPLHTDDTSLIIDRGEILQAVTILIILITCFPSAMKICKREDSAKVCQAGLHPKF